MEILNKLFNKKEDTRLVKYTKQLLTKNSDMINREFRYQFKEIDNEISHINNDIAETRCIRLKIDELDFKSLLASMNPDNLVDCEYSFDSGSFVIPKDMSKNVVHTLYCEYARNKFNFVIDLDADQFFIKISPDEAIDLIQTRARLEKLLSDLEIKQSKLKKEYDTFCYESGILW